MKTLSRFLALLLPQLGPILTRVPELIDLFKNAFTSVGGNEENWDKILEQNQIQINKLKNPDGFRHKKE